MASPPEIGFQPSSEAQAYEWPLSTPRLRPRASASRDALPFP